MDKLLTKKEVSERWQVTEQAIDKWRREGILTSCAGIPAVRFSLEHILKLEGVKLERFSPVERKKLESENEKLRLENEKLKGILSSILAESSKVINLVK